MYCIIRNTTAIIVMIVLRTRFGVLRWDFHEFRESVLYPNVYYIRDKIGWRRERTTELQSYTPAGRSCRFNKTSLIDTMS